jgi:hypothetical protein
MRLAWDQVGEREYEAGVDQGVLYLSDGAGQYDQAAAWNGLVTVTEAPTGADAHPQYADNIKYLNLIAAEQFGATIDAFTYPDEFGQCDGTAEPSPGVRIGQQTRKTFGLCYRTRIGNDVDGTDHGYRLHLVYGAIAQPSQKAYGTINDTPAAITFSWAITTTPVPVTGHKPAATITIDSTTVDAGDLTALENILYGTAGSDPRLPLPDEVIALFSGEVVLVETQAPAYNAATDIITIPNVVGVEYLIDGNVVPAGPFGPIAADTVVTAQPTAGHAFTPESDDDWTIRFA